jgi:hypothetical protein
MRHWSDHGRRWRGGILTRGRTLLLQETVKSDELQNSSSMHHPFEIWSSQSNLLLPSLSEDRANWEQRNKENPQFSLFYFLLDLSVRELLFPLYLRPRLFESCKDDHLGYSLIPLLSSFFQYERFEVWIELIEIVPLANQLPFSLLNRWSIL